MTIATSYFSKDIFSAMDDLYPIVKVSILLFLTIYFVYHLSLFTSVPGGDSGELLAESCVSSKQFKLSKFTQRYILYRTHFFTCSDMAYITMGTSPLKLLGTPHPPGYPLFTILAYAIAQIPFPRVVFTDVSTSFALSMNGASTVAWKVNHLCAVLGAFTAVFIWISSVEVLKAMKMGQGSYTIALLGAALYSFSPIVFEYSLTAEVFALNNFFCSLLLLLSCKIYNKLFVSSNHDTTTSTSTGTNTDKDDGDGDGVGRLIYAGALCSGLSLANQHASLLEIAFLVPSVVTAIVYCHQKRASRKQLTNRNSASTRTSSSTSSSTGNSTDSSNIWKPIVSQLLLSAVFFFVGLSPYLYLIWSGKRQSMGSWGDTGSLRGFIRHVLRSEYGTFQLGVTQGREGAGRRIAIYATHLSAETYHGMFVILLLGCAVSIQRHLLSFHQYQQQQEHTDRTNTTSSSSSDSITMSNGTGTKQNNKTSLIRGGKGKPLRKGMGGQIRAFSYQALAKSGLLLPSVLLSCWAFYTTIWHCVLSNLPLDSPMPFGVHARFWMQPNILAYTLFGSALSILLDKAFHLASSHGNIVSGSAINTIIQASILVSVLSAVLMQRFSIYDRSGENGMVMHSYGQAALNSLPPNSLLVSHTDLDWNPIRYLQHCEQQRKDVTHLSFQLMPYDWFASRQAPLYRSVALPNFAFPGVSTDRRSEGNAQLVSMFLKANGAHKLKPSSVFNSLSSLNNDDNKNNESITLAPIVLGNVNKNFPGGIYLDMQSINDPDLLPFGRWRNDFLLVPWGTLYRVVGNLNKEGNYSDAANNRVIHSLHVASIEQLSKLQKTFPEVNAQFIEKFPAGTWEFAAASVYYDAHYQTATNILEFCVELQKSLTIESLPLLLDRLLTAGSILRSTLQAQLSFKTFSGSAADLHKNTALCWARLYALFGVLDSQEAVILKTFQDLKISPQHHIFINTTILESKIFTASGRMRLTAIATDIVGGWLATYPSDRDAHFFESTYKAMTKAVVTEGKS